MEKNFSVGIPINRPMPIALDNNIPGIAVQISNLHNSPSACQNFLALVDSCAAMNISNLEIHQWIITKFPEIVADHISYDDTNSFQNLQLQVNIHYPKALL